MGFNLLDLRVMSSSHHVIVDGSNLATEGRMVPSLAQLDDCVQAYKLEDPTASIVVVVDATFGHRIDPSEKATYDEAIDHGELLTPPAGAVGRGDGFILKIAEKVNAVVLSNDSFQEFHGEYPWLFDLGRLIGGKPVPTIGWVFTPRSPVRGPKSRQATSKVHGASKAAPKPIAAKKLTVTLPDGAKPNIGDVISPPARSGEPPVPAPTPPKKRATKKSAQAVLLEASVEASQVVDTQAPKKRAAKKASPRAVAEQGPEEVPVHGEAEAPKTRGRKKTTTDVASPTETQNLPSVPKAPAKKRVARRATATVVEVAPDADLIVPAKKRGVKKASPKAQAATEELPQPKVAKPSSGRDPVPINEAMGFLTFVSAHPVDSIISGTVTSFTSHGAMVTVVLEGETPVLCYAPTKHLSQPAPKSAREVLTLGQTSLFKVLSLDVRRRVAEITLDS